MREGLKHEVNLLAEDVQFKNNQISSKTDEVSNQKIRIQEMIFEAKRANANFEAHLLSL